LILFSQVNKRDTEFKLLILINCYFNKAYIWKLQWEVLWSYRARFELLIFKNTIVTNHHGSQTANARASFTRHLDSNPGLAKSYTALQTVRHRFNIYASTVPQRWSESELLIPTPDPVFWQNLDSGSNKNFKLRIWLHSCSVVDHPCCSCVAGDAAAWRGDGTSNSLHVST